MFGPAPIPIDGDCTVDITIPDLSLLPGPFVIHTEVTGWRRQHIFDHLQNAFSFDVLAGTTHEVDGLVTLRPSWAINGFDVGNTR